MDVYEQYCNLFPQEANVTFQNVLSMRAARCCQTQCAMLPTEYVVSCLYY